PVGGDEHQGVVAEIARGREAAWGRTRTGKKSLGLRMLGDEEVERRGSGYTGAAARHGPQEGNEILAVAYGETLVGVGDDVVGGAAGREKADGEPRRRRGWIVVGNFGQSGSVGEAHDQRRHGAELRRAGKPGGGRRGR